MKSKYKTLTEWRKADPKAYNNARLSGKLEELCDIFNWEYDIRNPKGYWTFENCKKEALKYETRTEWQKNGGGSYNIAKKNGWVNECASHMILKSRPKGYWSLETCKAEALKFTKKIDWKTQSQGSYEFARQQPWYGECTAHMVSKSIPKGYWTKERCLEEALKHKRIVDWAKQGSSTAIRIAKNNGWFDECTAHMIVRKTKYGYWNKETCLKEAIKYTSKLEWSTSDRNSFVAAKRRGIVDECCSHMVDDKIELEWTKERCLEEALKYNTRKEWRLNSRISYNISRRPNNNWFDECCLHMNEKKNPNYYWTKERCIQEALKYKTRKEWRKASGGSFCRANKNGWLNECAAHMIMKTKPMGYWTKEKCIEDAKSYTNSTEWCRKSPSAYNAAHKNKWFEECAIHFVIKRKNKKKK